MTWDAWSDGFRSVKWRAWAPGLWGVWVGLSDGSEWVKVGGLRWGEKSERFGWVSVAGMGGAGLWACGRASGGFARVSSSG